MQDDMQLHLNQYVAFFVNQYLRKTNYLETGGYINQAAKVYPYFSSTDPYSGYISEYQSALSLVEKQSQLVLNNMRTGKLPSDHRDLRLDGGPQAWLISTYNKMLSHLIELDSGVMSYEFGGRLYRDIVPNVIASRMMFEAASKRLARTMVETHQHDAHETVLVEFGSGNGAATLTTLKAFHKKGLYPQFLLTDIDQKTEDVALQLYRQHGYQTSHFPWEKLNINDTNAVVTTLSKFPKFKIIANLNFIIHESEDIIENFFAAMSQAGVQEVVVSEFFLPPGYPNCKPNPLFPWWFVFIHIASKQFLRTEKDFMLVANKHGYYISKRHDHQVVDNAPVVSTLFLTRK